MSYCDRCSDSPVKAFSLGGFHAELCIHCLNEWEEMRYSDPYRKERLELEIMTDCIEADLRLSVSVSHESIRKANIDCDRINKMVFDMAKKFVLGDELKHD